MWVWGVGALPDMDDAVLTKPKIDPECLGAKSKQFVTVPNLWNDAANTARLTKARATGKDFTSPVRNNFEAF